MQDEQDARGVSVRRIVLTIFMWSAAIACLTTCATFIWIDDPAVRRNLAIVCVFYSVIYIPYALIRNLNEDWRNLSLASRMIIRRLIHDRRPHGT